jgi:hypothetical protein
MPRRCLPSLLVVIVLAAVAAAPAAATKPVASSTSTPALSGPASAHVGDTYTIEGSGFAPGSRVPLEIAEAGGCCIALNMFADASGRFSYSSSVWAPGTYRVRAFVEARNGRMREAASSTFDAYP